MAEQVFREILPYFNGLCANPHSTDHVLGWESAAAVEKAARRVGQLLSADADEIIFTSGATESNNLALLGCARRALAEDGKRRRIVVSSIEHKCVLAIGRVLESQLGCRVEILPVDNDGLISLPKLKSVLGDDVLAVSIMAVNNEIGTVQDIKGVSEIVRSYGSVLHCDAAQAPVALEMRRFANDVDLLSLSGHKMYGPKGIGALYIRRDLQGDMEPLIYGGGQQDGLRSGTVPTPLCVGMGAAAELLDAEEAGNMREQLRERRDRFVEKLFDLPWPITLNGPPLQHRHPGNTNICFRGFTAHDILGVLQPHLAASTGSACTSGMLEPSHVLKAIGLTGDEAEASIRFSLGFGTSDQDIDEAVALISGALNNLSDIHPLHSASTQDEARDVTTRQ